MNKPIIFAHRGCEEWNGEGIPSITTGVDGADYVEIDVRKTVDNVLVVSHYRSLKNAARRVLVDRSKYDQIFAKTGKRLFKLEEIVEELRRRASFNLDIKQPGMVPEIKKFIRRHRLEKEVLIDSPRHEELEQLSDRFPRAQFAYSFIYTDHRGLESYRVFKAMGYFAYFALYPLWPKLIKLWAKRTPFIPAASMYYRAVNQGVVDFFHDRDIPVYVWPVNRERSMKRMLELEVDGIKTSKPELLKKVLSTQDQ